MNPQIVIMTVVAAASFAFIGFLAYRIRVRSNEVDLSSISTLQDDSSLDEDFKDILAFVPTTEVRQIIERYVKYDAQIGDTVCFVNDQKRYDLEIADGGLMDTILRTIPLDELHELLRQKVKYSSRFRMFLYASRSKDYREMCIALEETKVLYHHSFWAKESGLEITFAIELYNEIYVYLTQTLVS
ncbi:hypothetical protein WH47_11746 [Habropoda laboriosa]|uniref:Uncharacterized protein n=1 Tax=Habropoda laboriosa TaxID=597456 RepID=A0A0L7R8D5_9HYME|nr:hypothetical protein WH47_11746 [Habropoda laboriosa]